MPNSQAIDDLNSSIAMRRLPPLSSLRAFESAARRESFKYAAAELGVTPTAISHQIRQLEAGLGVALFKREARGVVLTAEGRALYPALREAFGLMAGAVEEVTRRPLRRIATLSATVAFTARLLVPRAAYFRALNPGWDLRLHASDDPVDLEAGEADAAIRYGRGFYSGLEAVPLFADEFAPVCSPRLGVRRTEDLANATLIHFDWRSAALKRSMPTWTKWAEKARLKELDSRGGISFNDESSAIQAAIAGQGVALLSLTLVAAELASGSLVQPFGPRLEGLGYHFVFPPGTATRPAVSVLQRWLSTEFIPEMKGAEQVAKNRKPAHL